MRRTSFLFVLAVAAVSSAKPDLAPFTLWKNGAVVGSVFDVKGGYQVFGGDATTCPSYTPLEFIPSDSLSLLQEVLPLGRDGDPPATRLGWGFTVTQVTPVTTVDCPSADIVGVVLPATGPKRPPMLKEIEYLKVIVKPQVIVWMPPLPTSAKTKQNPFAVDSAEVMINGTAVAGASVDAFPIRVGSSDLNGTGVPTRAYSASHFALDLDGASLGLHLGETADIEVVYRSSTRNSPGIAVRALTTVVGVQPSDLFGVQTSANSGTSMHWVLEVRALRVEMK